MANQNPKVETDLVLLRCSRCGGDVPIADRDEVVCPYCGHAVAVPEAHRRAVRLVRDQDEELRRADEAWKSYSRGTWPPWLATLLACPPSAVLAAGVLAALFEKLGVLALGADPRTLLGAVGILPLVLLVPLAVVAYWSSQKAAGTRLTRLMLAARPGKVPCCRACGAPLSLTDGALFVRCAYCRTDSLVTLDALEARALVENIQRAEASASTALESAAARRQKASWAARFMAFIWLGMMALVLVWAFVPALDHVVALVALDMFALSMLTFMMAAGSLVEAIERSGRSGKAISGVLGLAAFAVAIASAWAVWMIAD